MFSFWSGRAYALAALIVSFLAGPVAAAPALWVVKDADSEIYLFGTLHVLEPGLDWRTPAFETAYGRAEQVWFETSVDADPAAVRALMARYGVDPDRRLTEKLSPEATRRLKPLLNKGRIAIEDVESLRPWAAAMVLSVLPMTAKGSRLDAGADAVITQAAKQAAKPVRTFESLEDQLLLFAKLPEPVEMQFLEDVLEEQATPARETWTLQQAWLDGDVQALGERLVDEMREGRPELYEALLKRRNTAWTETLSQEMAGSGVALVNVGALHMVGDDGLPAMMQARGFTVERVQ